MISFIGLVLAASIAGAQQAPLTPIPLTVKQLLCLKNLSKKARSDSRVVLYYYSKQCTLCPEMDDLISRLETKYPTLVVKRLDAYKSSSCTSTVGVFATPTLMFYKFGKLWARGDGLPSYEQLDGFVRQFLGIKAVKKDK